MLVCHLSLWPVSILISSALCGPNSYWWHQWCWDQKLAPCLYFSLAFPLICLSLCFSSKTLCCSSQCFAGILDYSWHSHSLASWSRSGYNPDQKQVANQQASNLLAHNRSDSVTTGSPLPSLKFGQKVVVGGGSWRQWIVNHIAKNPQTPQPQNGSFGTEQSQIPSQHPATRQTSKAQYCSTLVMCFLEMTPK